MKSLAALLLGTLAGLLLCEGVTRCFADRLLSLSDPHVRFDPGHLRQVLWNLVRNAWRHSRRQAGSVRLAALRRANQVELHVIDDGEGVAKELQAQLFEPFFTTFANGTGLGLYIARELCVANGASLDYLDRGQGADFRILWQAP